MTGIAAEILIDSVRQQSAQENLELPSGAISTMLYGHIESLSHRIHFWLYAIFNQKLADSLNSYRCHLPEKNPTGQVSMTPDILESLRCMLWPELLYIPTLQHPGKLA
jgi:hypothetical protein